MIAGTSGKAEIPQTWSQSEWVIRSPRTRSPRAATSAAIAAISGAEMHGSTSTASPPECRASAVVSQSALS
jgi:hypothetical protein